jgi:hypothetical protein
MDDDQLDDLKQFITSTVSQSEQRLTGRIDGLEKKMDDGFNGVGEAIAEINDRMDKRDAEVDTRLSNIESAQA